MISAPTLNNTGWVKEFYEKNKSIIIFLLKFIIAGGLLAFIISRISLSEIVTAIQSANLTLIGVAFLLVAINLFLQFLKWKLVCGKILDFTDNKKILISLFHGITAGSFTPARVGEYFGRAMMFKDKPFIQVTMATVVDKFFMLIEVAFVGAISSILFLYSYYNLTLLTAVGLIILAVSILGFLLFLAMHPRLWENALVEKLSVSKKLASFIEKISILKKMDLKFSLQLLLITLLFLMCIISQYAILAAAFSNHWNFFDFAWAGMLVMFAKSIVPPVAIADLGVREGASVFFLSKFGEIQSVGFNSSIFIFLINILFPAIIGLFLLFKKNDA